MKSITGRGFGTRYDKFTPNSIQIHSDNMPGNGYGESLGGKKLLCIKCQKDKKILGGSRRGGFFMCSECK